MQNSVGFVGVTGTDKIRIELLGPSTMINETRLENIRQLACLVEIDQNTHKLKEIATLFVNAMNNWPRLNQSRIFEFIAEFEEYFGKPVTREKILGKSINYPDDSVWKHESGSAIIDMLRLSETYYQSSSFESIVQAIINYYQEQLEMIDFIADLQYRTAKGGGRTAPVFSKYRPQIKFEFDEMQTSGEQTFINKSIVYPGESSEAIVRIIALEYFKNRLEEGMCFEFREGTKVIGTGRITQILNEKLRIPVNISQNA
ncbi:hypothetical protein FAZ15_10100 [Sphingobacterium olei]|uniref:Translation elongation factor EFTu/EF1A C-terminal domain-containing protein n=1 Tax=Sphingobacterium olei TaxID=2571155 RepID=A0A4U0P339_9SPHI|nr:hypothetical protein [Sphingobacterium olei]TJZ61530.1 hypothetical protein FAZ15_10100 [Sphingobacterium olei]